MLWTFDVQSSSAYFRMESVTSFFANKTVEDVKTIKIKTRSDIERKKEELRQMVGERYVLEKLYKPTVSFTC